MNQYEVSKKLKKLKHVQVYNKIYQLIQDGVYSPGMQLPSEPELAEQLNVSRMTLRKSLALLQEDHLVKNIRGKGNFVRKLSNTCHEKGLETLQHPIKACLNNPNTYETELEFRIEVPTEAIKDTLKQETPIVVVTDRWYHQNDSVIAYSLSFIPSEVLSDYSINLANAEDLTKFLEETIYQNNNSCCAQNELCFTKTGNFAASKYILSENNAFVLIQETIFKDYKVLVVSKHYIPVEYFELCIFSKRDDLK
ncbi:GntR family transcriptional regulator [Streptococcus catagoni]|uniref:GntR family transcriptional regulator n=1 Tax=Streptococcus catagoni TaxID=2654874 RepID=UPI00140C0D56|nr:GntR family transcriptional regulator [Streptococcus catagoni]